MVATDDERSRSRKPTSDARSVAPHLREPSPSNVTFMTPCPESRLLPKEKTQCALLHSQEFPPDRHPARLTRAAFAPRQRLRHGHLYSHARDTRQRLPRTVVLEVSHVKTRTSARGTSIRAKGSSASGRHADAQLSARYAARHENFVLVSSTEDRDDDTASAQSRVVGRRLPDAVGLRGHCRSAPMHTGIARPRVMLGAWSLEEPPTPGRGPSRRSTRRRFSIRREFRKTIIECGRGETIFTQRDACGHVMYIQSGGVKLSVLSQTGREAVVAMPRTR
jgi:hypothetical protein